MKKYKTIAELVAAAQADEIPANVVSPGAAAAMLGVTRQAINDRIHRSKTLEAWGAEGVVLISVESINRAIKAREEK